MFRGNGSALKTIYCDIFASSQKKKAPPKQAADFGVGSVP
jgi:hypothetical protein